MLAYHEMVYLVHIVIVGPLLVYIGYFKNRVDKNILNALVVLGAIVILYHGYKFVDSIRNKVKVI